MSSKTANNAAFIFLHFSITLELPLHEFWGGEFHLFMISTLILVPLWNYIWTVPILALIYPAASPGSLHCSTIAENYSFHSAPKDLFSSIVCLLAILESPVSVRKLLSFHIFGQWPLLMSPACV